jgi:hypothetical protein
LLKYRAGTSVKKEYLPMALGFWGVGLPLAAFGLLFGRTTAERLTVLALAAVFVLVGALIYRARR